MHTACNGMFIVKGQIKKKKIQDEHSGLQWCYAVPTNTRPKLDNEGCLGVQYLCYLVEVKGLAATWSNNGRQQHSLS